MKPGRDLVAGRLVRFLQLPQRDPEAARRGVAMSHPIKISPEASSYRVSLLDGTDGLSGVYAADTKAPLVCVAVVLGVPDEVQLKSPVLDVMKMADVMTALVLSTAGEYHVDRGQRLVPPRPLSQEESSGAKTRPGLCLMPLLLQTLQRYGDTVGAVEWRGVEVLDHVECLEYLAGPVANRVRDAPAVEDLAQDLQSLATTSMGTDTIERLLTSDGRRESWEVGEALAECFLEEELGVQWPWNTNRDRKTPRASLPGADLVGFIDLGGGAEFAFGEVKTSEDDDTPPTVMTGRTGMIHQLEVLADNTEHHFTLIKWLHARCKNTEYWPSFQSAARQYLEA